MHDTSATSTAKTPTVDEVADHMLAAFLPPVHDRHPHPAAWPARDMTLGQLKTLFMLRAQGPLSVGRIAEAFGIGAAAASGYIERIERHGLIERQHRTDDRRIVDCHLTDDGRKLLDDLAGLRTDGLRRALGVLNPQELADLDRILTAIATRTRPQEAQS